MRSELWVALYVVALCGCDDPAKGKAAAAVASAVTIVEAAAPSAPVARYAVASTTSRIGFVGSKVTGRHEGSFGKFAGTIEIPDGKLEAATITLTIEPASLKTDDEELDEHLKSKDFFDVARYPKASFTSTSIVPGGNGGATHTLTGNLELHGVTRSIGVPATIKLEDGVVTAASEFTIKRRDFGIVYPGKPDDLIKDEVLVKISLKAALTR